MSLATMTRTAERIADHATTHELKKVWVVLHGGEPLLAGPARLEELITALRGPLRGVCEIDVRLHTNGVLLNGRFCDMFREQGVKVGISLDGDRTANDRHRLYRNGRSSYDKAVQAVELLRRDYPDLYSGLLCTIDIANDPIAVYDALVSHDPPAIDFLWPHHTWEQPPARTSRTAYAQWLTTIFGRWLAQGRPVPVRVFDSIINAGRGGHSQTESLGLEPVDLLVIETDGEYELADSLKTAFDGAADTGMTVFAHDIDQAARHQGIQDRQGGLAALCDTCRECPVVATCGGGLYAHRYRADGSRFANPSVYCDDLKALIGHVQQETEVLSTDAIRSLATGHGDLAAVRELENAETIGHRALIAAIGTRTEPGEAWAVITKLWGSEALDAALAHPYLRVRAVQHLNDGKDEKDGLLETLACVAAERAGLDTTLTAPVHGDGTIYFPALGRYHVAGRTTTTVRIRDGILEVDGADRMEPVRRLTAGTFSVLLDDLDPFRDCHDWPAAERLDDATFEAWQATFEQAWKLMERDFPEYAPAVASALTTIVPLADPGTGRSVSSAARDAFGSVGIALPATPDLLCLLILHEFQHVKLGAVLDFVDLYDPADDRKYDAPWREDPRPLEGLLQGTYAHIAVADFWRRQGDARQYGTWYPHTLAACGTLQGSGALTGLGEQFVAEMRATLESWSAAP
jgi:uncharacterized protein